MLDELFTHGTNFNAVIIDYISIRWYAVWYHKCNGAYPNAKQNLIHLASVAINPSTVV